MKHRQLPSTVKPSRFCESLAWKKGDLNDSTYRAFCRFAGHVLNRHSSAEASLILDEVALLIKRAGDSVKPDKLIDQFSQAFAYVACCRAAKSLGMWPLLKPASKWPKPEPELIESLAGSLKLRDWEDISPATASEPQEVLPMLFPPKSLICGKIAKTEHFIRELGEDLYKLARRAQFVVPNPAKAPFVEMPDGRRSLKCKENYPDRRYLIIEFDHRKLDPERKLSLDALLDLQAALHAHLSVEHAPLAMLVYSGGVSLHGWYPCEGIDEGRVLEFLRYACRLGADHCLSAKSFFTRMPGGVRDNGNRQTIHYIDPEVLL